MTILLLINQDYYSYVNLLPLMYIYELNDLMFLIKSLNTPTENFDIKDFISLNTSNTRSGSHLKLCHPRAQSTNHHHFYFNRIVRLWNHMPVIDISLPSHVIKQNLTKYLWNHFTANFNSDQSCTYHYLCLCYRCSRQPISYNFHDLITATNINNHITTNM